MLFHYLCVCECFFFNFFFLVCVLNSNASAYIRTKNAEFWSVAVSSEKFFVEYVNLRILWILDLERRDRIRKIFANGSTKDNWTLRLFLQESLKWNPLYKIYNCIINCESYEIRFFFLLILHKKIKISLVFATSYLKPWSGFFFYFKIWTVTSFANLKIFIIFIVHLKYLDLSCKANARS